MINLNSEEAAHPINPDSTVNLIFITVVIIRFIITLKNKKFECILEFVCVVASMVEYNHSSQAF